MRSALFAVFAAILLTLSACVVEPLGEGTGDRYRSDHYRGDHEEGHRVWHE